MNCKDWLELFGRDSEEARLGEPSDHNGEFDWDEWRVGGLSVNVTYTKDHASLDSIALSLPAEMQ